MENITKRLCSAWEFVYNRIIQNHACGVRKGSPILGKRQCAEK